MAKATTTAQTIRITIISLLIFAFAISATASELALRLANDPSFGNPRPDDLYTSDIQIVITGATRRYVFGERMFTDRERRLRFDETHLSIETPLPPIGQWNTGVSLGILHVGKGLIGEGAQNAVHRALRSEEVSLPYVPDNRVYPTASLTLSRPVTENGRVQAHFEAYTAPGFRNWVHGSIQASRPVGRNFDLGAGLGIRADEAESARFADAIGGISPTAHLSVSWRALEVRASWNDYGTRSPHVSLGFKTNIP